ncbi:MAG: maleylpyruvate isomerase family mycothiol-dependent enzyme [Micromonosporaceae bacterium]|nr:maleylpyruvate isomerase family mycothiol-dependent enzyme [Micromonosporaceae bacterium]
MAGMAQRFADLGLAAPDPEIPISATPGWSLTDVFGHVMMEVNRYRELATGRGDWPADVADLPAFNAEQIRTLPTRDVGELAARLRTGTEELVATIDAFGDEQPLMPFDGDQWVRADRQLGTLLGELVVHGRDIARETGAAWPIDREHVPLVFDGLHQVLPGWVGPDARGHTATYQLRLRGDLGRYVYAFADGRLTINPAEPPAIDVHVSADPVTALLSSYRRIGRWWPALSGKTLAWGRRPWLAARLNDRFRSP